MTIHFFKKFSSITFIFLAFSFLMGCKDEKNKNTLTIATCADYPPFEYYKEGKLVGFEIELMELIGKELAKQVTFKDLAFDSIIGSLQSQRVDGAISSISSTPERQEKVDFTIPYYNSKTVILVDQSSPFNKIEDLHDLVIGVQMGSTYENFIKNDWLPHLKNVTLQSLNKMPELIQNFKTQRIKAIGLGLTEAKAIIEEIPGLKIIEIPNTEMEHAIALPKNSPLKELFNKAILTLKQNGTLAKLEEKWIDQGNSNA